MFRTGNHGHGRERGGPRRFGPGRAAALVVLLAAAVAPRPAHALRVTTWNLLNYIETNITSRQPKFRTVMQNLDTDVIMVQELKTSAAADSFLLNVLRASNPAKVWKNAGFLSLTESAIYYDSLKASVNIPTAINTGGPRQVYQLLLSPNGYAATASKIRLYSVHFKAGDPALSPADSLTRRVECTNLRGTLNNAPAGTNILMGGDTNFYGDWEGGYQRLTESQLDNDGRLADLVSMPGTWNQFAYRCYHTESPCLSGCVGAGGGLDDRFDLFLSSYPMGDGEKVDFTQFFAYGNDCNHYNENINQDGRNSAVPIAVADALHDASDHIPVVATIQLPAKIAATSQLDFGTCIVGAAVTRDVSVANAATLLPADELTYGFTPTAGLIVPSGTFQAAAVAPANVHTINLDTASPRALGGPLGIACDDVDSLSKNVLVSGTVLGHAVASLDSLSAVQAASVTFGNHPAQAIPDLAVRVHNFGWTGMQARLSVTNATLAGGDGRFSIVGGFAPGLVAGTAKTLSIHFDDTGATPDQDYQATLTITSADEPLPGGASEPDLVVTLHAFVSSGATATTEALPTAIAFLPARPNPFGARTALHYELPKRSPVSLAIYDPAGRRVRALAGGVRDAGRYDVGWDATDASGARVPAGLYFARFLAPGFIASRRIVVLP